ncbi:MAG: hypothetical protein GC164_09840 [Phycisphaera sp.]|nr:hypothetical protein [Phycisphaera sp.]
MSTDRNPHGTTLHQGLVLAIISKLQPCTSGEVAAEYTKLTKIKLAYNYQYIITRRMEQRGLIKQVKSKSSTAFQWTLAPQGKKTLTEVTKLAAVLAKA